MKSEGARVSVAGVSQIQKAYELWITGIAGSVANLPWSGIPT